MTSWWYETAKGFIGQAYEFLNNEESIGETISEFAYTVQTGYPRYILNNFSVEDLKKFLEHPQIDSFFVSIRKSPIYDDEDEERLEYGLIYKNQSKKGKWYVSHVKENKYIVSTPLIEYITGKSTTEGYFDSDEQIMTTILSDNEEIERSDEDIDYIFADSDYEEKILLLRPKTGSFSNHKTRKLVARYESQKESFASVSSEQYIFQLLLGQPEFLDPHLFGLIRELFIKSLTTSSSTETAKICKKISALFDDTFRTYRIGLIL